MKLVMSLLGLLLIGFLGTAFAEQIPVNIQTLNDTDFIISGTIQTPKDGDQIAITVKNNFDVIIFVSQIVPDSSGYFSLDVTRQGDLWKNTESFTVNAVRTSVYDKEVILAMLKPGKNQIISPKAQVVMGFEPSDVMCNRDLQLVIKSSDGSPACVKPETIGKLIERGWALNQRIPEQDQSEDKIITPKDNDKLINIKKGESFVVKLDSNYSWRMDIDNKTVVNSDYSDIRYSGYQGVYKADNSGQAILTGIGDPLCLSSDPPCKSPSILFQLNINVK